MFSSVGLARVAFASHSADLTGDGQVNQADLDILRSQWGQPGNADLNHDGTVSAIDAGILFSSWGAIATPPPPPPPPPSGGCPWTQASCWPGGVVPNRNTDAMIPVGTTIEVNTTGAEARTLHVHGTLRASRTTNSTLTMYGNLIAMDNGVVDYGRTNDRVTAQARIRFVLNEANYVGGAASEPLASDVGFWFMDNARLYVHGLYRDTWSPLTQTAAPGAAEFRVDPAYAQGWQVNDEVVLTQTEPVVSEADRGVPKEERRRITAVLGPGHFRLNSPLVYSHEVSDHAWTDAWGDTYTERLAGKVANLTSNIVFEAADPNHRPHTMFMDQAKFFVEDLAVVNFSPIPKFIGPSPEDPEHDLPMGRYAWHIHIQDNGSQGSYLRRARIYDGVGNGVVLHESWGVEITDLVVYNQARFAARDAQGRLVTARWPIFLESSIGDRYPGDDQNHTADNCWIERALVVGRLPDTWGSAGLIWWPARNCAIVGAVSTGFGLGLHWPEGGSGEFEQIHIYRAEAFGNGLGFFSWINTATPERIVDLLAWNNNTGIDWGAYGTAFWLHQARSIGNVSAQIKHHAVGWGLTGFLADGRNRPGTEGIRVMRYAAESGVDSVYEDGVVRNVSRNVTHAPTPDSSATSKVQFARVRFQPGVGVFFDGSPNRFMPPPGSYLRFRNQQGLERPANFTLYHREHNIPYTEGTLDVVNGSLSDPACAAGDFRGCPALLVTPRNAPAIRQHAGTNQLIDIAGVRYGMVGTWRRTERDPFQLILDRPYAGPTATGVSYALWNAPILTNPITDTAYNALRNDNDTDGVTEPPTPRLRWVAPTPADDAVASGGITLAVETNAPSVKFYMANNLLATVPVVNGRATHTCNMSSTCWGTRPAARRAYFWAEAMLPNTTPDGLLPDGTNTSRVLRVRNF